jgi:hypothetical protein
MITREIKVGDRLRSAKGFEITVVELAPDGQSLWDTHRNTWVGPFANPEYWEHVDPPQADPQADPVNHPPHYTQGNIECIDSDKRCKTCHWWFGSEGTHRPCVFHIGMKGEKERRIDYGGNKTLRTRADFGCTEWIKDKR